MQYRFENEYGLDVSIGISEVFSGIDQIKNAYNDAVDSIKKRYFLSENSNISVKKYEDADSSDIYKWAKNIVYEAILSGDTTQVRNMANRLFSAASTLPNVNEQQNFLIYLLLLPFNLLSNIKNDDDNSRLTVGEVLTEFLCCSKPEEKEKFILKIYEKIMDLMSPKKETRSGIIIRHVKNTIKNKYMEQISVASIAETVNLTPTYLSVLFNKETGETINDYITRVRLENAKKLLCDPTIKINDICLRVGYLSLSYFTKLFKKYTGMTPGQYRLLNG